MLVKVDEVFQDLLIYSSADMNKGKWSGNGYKHVQQQEGIDIFNWVHTGDNKASDIGQARDLGIKTVYFNGAALTQREGELMAKHEADVSLQLAVGGLRLRRLQGEDVSLDVLPELPDEEDLPFGMANKYPVGECWRIRLPCMEQGVWDATSVPNCRSEGKKLSAGWIGRRMY